MVKGLKVRFAGNIISYIPFSSVRDYYRYHSELGSLFGEGIEEPWSFTGARIEEVLEDDVELYEVVCLGPDTPEYLVEFFAEDIDRSGNVRYLPKDVIEDMMEDGCYIIARDIGVISDVCELR